MSAHQRGVSLSDITFQMNKGSSFRSLLQLVSSVQKKFWNVRWSQCRSHRANFWPQCTSWFTGLTNCRRATGREALPNIRLGGRHCASKSKPNSCPRWQKGQVRPEALRRRFGGAPKTGNSRNHGDQVSQTVFHKYGLYSFSTAPA